MKQIPRSSIITALVVVMLALLTFALLFALRPYRLRFDLVSDRVRDQGSFEVKGACIAAVTSAWDRSEPDELKLWAVTVGKDMVGYVPVRGSSVKSVLLGETPLTLADCAPESRHRLIVAGWVLLATLGVGATIVVVARREP